MDASDVIGISESGGVVAASPSASAALTSATQVPAHAALLDLKVDAGFQVEGTLGPLRATSARVDFGQKDLSNGQLNRCPSVSESALMSNRLPPMLVLVALIAGGCGSTSVSPKPVGPTHTAVAATPQPSASASPSSAAPAWTATTLNNETNNLVSVSCPTTQLCVAVDDGGDAVTSTNPTGGASAWSIVDVDESNSINAVSCPTATLCVAVDNAGQVLISTNPSGGAATWTAIDVDSDYDLDGVSCPGVSLCVAVDEEGYVVTSNAPTGGASAWKAVPGIDNRFGCINGDGAKLAHQGGEAPMLLQGGPGN
jgi:hypothetical protein